MGCSGSGSGSSEFSGGGRSSSWSIWSIIAIMLAVVMYPEAKDFGVHHIRAIEKQTIADVIRFRDRELAVTRHVVGVA